MDYEHDVGLGRVDMERGPDSVWEVDGSEASGNRQGEGEQDDHETNLPLVGRVSGQVRLYEERGRGVRRETGTTNTKRTKNNERIVGRKAGWAPRD